MLQTFRARRLERRNTTVSPVTRRSHRRWHERRDGFSLHDATASLPTGACKCRQHAKMGQSSAAAAQRRSRRSRADKPSDTPAASVLPVSDGRTGGARPCLRTAGNVPYAGLVAQEYGPVRRERRVVIEQRPRDSDLAGQKLCLPPRRGAAGRAEPKVQPAALVRHAPIDGWSSDARHDDVFGVICAQSKDRSGPPLAVPATTNRRKLRVAAHDHPHLATATYGTGSSIAAPSSCQPTDPSRLIATNCCASMANSMGSA